MRRVEFELKYPVENFEIGMTVEEQFFKSIVVLVMVLPRSGMGAFGGPYFGALVSLRIPQSYFLCV